MNKTIMEKAGFGQVVKDVEKGICPFCKKEIDEADFIDANSRQEHGISGLCQACQDETFGPNTEAQENLDSYCYKKPYRMTCGSAEAEKRRYKKLDGNDGRVWLVPIGTNNPATYIHVSGNKGSDGYGGRTLTFTLENGETLTLTGPWHSNSDALFAATGHDVRDKHLTFGVVALERKDGWLNGILHKDEKPTLGTFSRIQDTAERIAAERNERVFYYMESSGGSSCAKVDPIDTTKN